MIYVLNSLVWSALGLVVGIRTGLWVLRSRGQIHRWESSR